MNAKSLLIGLTVSFALSSGLAAEKVKNPPAAPAKKVKAVPEAPQTEKNVRLTGSYIKRDVRRNCVVTDGPTSVYVIDSEAIRNSGAYDLSQLLLRRGFRR